MATRDDDQTEISATIVWPEPEPDDKALYANGVAVNHTPWDFALHFYQVVMPLKPAATATPPLEIRGRNVALISFPVTLVRGFIDALEVNLKRYEERHGKVEIPRKTKESNGQGSPE